MKSLIITVELNKLNEVAEKLEKEKFNIDSVLDQIGIICCRVDDVDFDLIKKIDGVIDIEEDIQMTTCEESTIGGLV